MMCAVRRGGGGGGGGSDGRVALRLTQNSVLNLLMKYHNKMVSLFPSPFIWWWWW